MRMYVRTKERTPERSRRRLSAAWSPPLCFRRGKDTSGKLSDVDRRGPEWSSRERLRDSDNTHGQRNQTRTLSQLPLPQSELQKKSPNTTQKHIKPIRERSSFHLQPNTPSTGSSIPCPPVQPPLDPAPHPLYVPTPSHPSIVRSLGLGRERGTTIFRCDIGLFVQCLDQASKSFPKFLLFSI